MAMAEYYQNPTHQQNPTEATKSFLSNKGLSNTQILAVVTLLPIGGILLTLSGVTLTGTLIGMALATPVFVIFSPVLVPAAIVLALAVTGFLTSGALGLTALFSCPWIVNHVLGPGASVPDQLDSAKLRIQSKTGGHEGGRT